MSKPNHPAIHPPKELTKLPLAPPLSRPIAYLDGMLDDGVPLIYPNIPDIVTRKVDENGEEGFAWSGPIMKEVFPLVKGYGVQQVPVCLLMDAVTVQDKWVTTNWWRLLSKQQQADHFKSLRDIYATPRKSNRLLPPDFYHKLAGYRAKGVSKPTLPPGLASILPDPETAKADSRRVKEAAAVDVTCRGWYGPKYDDLFRMCLAEAIRDDTTVLTTSGGVATLADKDVLLFKCIPIAESLANSERTRALHFVAVGTDFVLRSVDCLGQRMAKTGNLHCDACRSLRPFISSLIKRKDVSAEKIAKQEGIIRTLRSDLQREKRRVRRLKERPVTPVGRRETKQTEQHKRRRSCSLCHKRLL